MTFSDLPQELLASICDFLPIHDRVALASVSKDVADATRISGFLRELHFDGRFHGGDVLLQRVMAHRNSLCTIYVANFDAAERWLPRCFHTMIVRL